MAINSVFGVSYINLNVTVPGLSPGRSYLSIDIWTFFPGAWHGTFPKPFPRSWLTDFSGWISLVFGPCSRTFHFVSGRSRGNYFRPTLGGIDSVARSQTTASITGKRNYLADAKPRSPRFSDMRKASNCSGSGNVPSDPFCRFGGDFTWTETPIGGWSRRLRQTDTSGTVIYEPF